MPNPFEDRRVQDIPRFQSPNWEESPINNHKFLLQDSIPHIWQLKFLCYCLTSPFFGGDLSVSLSDSVSAELAGDIIMTDMAYQNLVGD